MKALTVQQPWATLLIKNRMHNDTRSWGTAYRGPIYIYAGKSRKDVFSEIYADEERYPFFKEAGIGTYKKVDMLPRGMILGTVILTDCMVIDEAYQEYIRTNHPAEYAFGDYTVGRYVWIFKDPVPLIKPFPASGKSSPKLWDWG